MNKTVAVRSQARRAALTKVALDNVGSEVGGTFAAPLTGAVIGSVPGAILGALAAAAKGRSISQGIGAGALGGAGVGLAGSHLANLGGVLAAVIRERRTKKEQQEHDSKSHWENFIPGVGSYNYTKRMGRVLAGVGEPDEPGKKAAEAVEAAYAEGFCKAAEALGVSPRRLAVRMAVKEAALTRGNLLKWLMQLSRTSSPARTLGGRLTGTAERLNGVGRLSKPVAENLTQMRNLADSMELYTAARGAATGWLGKPSWVGSTLDKGKKFFPQLVEDAASGNSDLSGAAKSLLRAVGYIK